MKPGFLIGGVPGNFGETARLGETPFFVIEADEYDTAFFDKRSKFVHYHPRTLLVNNLEFDHADIFDDLHAIQKQFHHVIRTVPSEGLIISPQNESAIEQTIDMGCWTQRQTIGIESGDVKAVNIADDGSEFDVVAGDEVVGNVTWSMLGMHNVSNALAAISAAHHVGVTYQQACESLSGFKGIKRRMELRGEVNGVRVYDDFAHHPTAIKTTIEGLRANIGDARLVAVLEPRSNTMKMGVHQHTLAASLADADVVYLYQDEGLTWSLDEVKQALSNQSYLEKNIDSLVANLASTIEAGDHVLIMSNGGFGGIHQRLLEALAND
jgi:UDP-N-acetylmuramate: L-alanyl-gamma-D-glutamyl-meso-diaminopimelate ligase